LPWSLRYLRASDPFGLAMIEALACGTPVIAFRRGSVPEIIDEGVTRLIGDDLNAAVKCIERVSTICRKRCREVFEMRFQASQMAQNYCHVYERATTKTHRPASRSLFPASP
jgi:glycosyltransferase involved in cell wall biosynthesis